MKEIEDFENAIPTPVKKAFKALHDAGYEGFVVGGCVRDSMLGKEPHDWDMTTNATPQQMKEALSRFNSFDTGIQHGTVTFLIDGEPIEVTTYRKDGEYSDGRHPDSVEFTSDIAEDLARRDFTVNAMAWSPGTGLVDPFGGEADLGSKTLRAVGDPYRRFDEDGLRVMRALRFAAKYGFDISPETSAAVHDMKEKLSNVSEERISAELVKMMESPDGEHLSEILGEYNDVVFKVIPELEVEHGFDQKNKHHDRNVWEHTLAVVSGTPADANLRLAALFHDVGKPYTQTFDDDGWAHYYGHMGKSKEITDAALARMKFSNKDIEEIGFLVGNHDPRPLPKTKTARRFLAKCGSEERARKLSQLMMSDAAAHAPASAELSVRLMGEFNEVMDSALAHQLAFKQSDMDFNGHDLMEMGVQPGPEMGAMLKELFSKVVDGEILNDHDALVAEAGNMLSGNNIPFSFKSPVDEHEEAPNNTGAGAAIKQKAARSHPAVDGKSAGRRTPSSSSRPGSANDGDMYWVEPFIRGNGVKVRGHWRRRRRS